MSKICLKNAQIVNEQKIINGSIFIENEFISKIIEGLPDESSLQNYEVIDVKGCFVIPGVIDDQVHFREPGLTQKGDIYTESKAAVAGGVTSFMDMPNTVPPAVTLDLLEQKYETAAYKSLANYSFYLGASNDNVDEVLKADPLKICGLKIFMGSSTGNLLVDNMQTLNRLFAESPLLIAAHCEDEYIVKANLAKYKQQFGENIPVWYHPVIRNEEACYKSTALAVELASKYNARLNVLHLSTARELKLFDCNKPVHEKRITAEVCVHHLIYNETDYKTLGPKIKWNPAIKTENDRAGLLSGINHNYIDIVATDHAPHTIEEKQINKFPDQYNYFKSASGGPLIQHSLLMMLGLYKKGLISLETIVEKMCHNPAVIYKIKKRGFIRDGYYADLTVIDPDCVWELTKNQLLYKCNWSPIEGQKLTGKITYTFINGKLVYDNGIFHEENKGMRLLFTV